jgi:hypothetical protein
VVAAFSRKLGEVSTGDVDVDRKYAMRVLAHCASAIACANASRSAG